MLAAAVAAYVAVRRATGFTFSTIIMDRLFFLARRLEHLSVATHGVEAFEPLLAENKGFLLASAHFGSFEARRVLAIRWFDCQPIPGWTASPARSM